MKGERREHTRFQLPVPVELRVQGTESAIKGETADISLGGFYLPTMFPMAVGTELDITLQLGASPLPAIGRVVTCDRTVGNGIRFLRMLPEDREELRQFLQAAEAEQDSAPRDQDP